MHNGLTQPTLAPALLSVCVLVCTCLALAPLLLPAALDVLILFCFLATPGVEQGYSMAGARTPRDAMADAPGLDPVWEWEEGERARE